LEHAGSGCHAGRGPIHGIWKRQCIGRSHAQERGGKTLDRSRIPVGDIQILQGSAALKGASKARDGPCVPEGHIQASQRCAALKGVGKTLDRADIPICDSERSNVWHTLKGAGKACKNMIRLALVPPDSDETTIPLMFDLPPTSTKSFLDTYRKLGNLPVQTVVMKFELDPSVTYPKTITSLLSPAPDSIAPFILPLMEKAQPGLARGFDYD
jgi:hypothetical protein